jgi:hypothetical protein
VTAVVRYPHGTITGYTAYGCRDECCRAVKRAYQLAWTRRNRELGRQPPVHGLGGYKNYGCRCPVCSDANSVYCRLYAERVS